MMLGMAFWQPLQKLLNVNQEFARYADSQVDLTMAKLTFIALNICGICMTLTTQSLPNTIVIAIVISCPCCNPHCYVWLLCQ
jgi:hydrogenase/urease accessory protein HupE